VTTLFSTALSILINNISGYTNGYSNTNKFMKMNNIIPRTTLMQFMGHSDGSDHDGYIKAIPEEQF